MKNTSKLANESTHSSSLNILMKMGLIGLPVKNSAVKTTVSESYKNTSADFLTSFAKLNARSITASTNLDKSIAAAVLKNKELNDKLSATSPLEQTDNDKISEKIYNSLVF